MLVKRPDVRIVLILHANKTKRKRHNRHTDA
jgi:hypothetical protein